MTRIINSYKDLTPAETDFLLDGRGHNPEAEELLLDCGMLTRHPQTGRVQWSPYGERQAELALSANWGKK